MPLFYITYYNTSYFKLHSLPDLLRLFRMYVLHVSRHPRSHMVVTITGVALHELPETSKLQRLLGGGGGDCHYYRFRHFALTILLLIHELSCDRCGLLCLPLLVMRM